MLLGSSGLLKAVIVMCRVYVLRNLKIIILKIIIYVKFASVLSLQVIMIKPLFEYLLLNLAMNNLINYI